MELLVSDMVSVQGDDLIWAKARRQCRAPAIQQILGQKQSIPMLVDDPLGEAVNVPRCLSRAARDLGPQSLLPQALALARAQLRPSSRAIGFALFGDGPDRRAPGVPLDDDSHCARKRLPLHAEFAHKLGRAQARFGAKQDRHGCQTRRYVLDPLKIKVRLQDRMLCAWMQCQLQAIALDTHVAGARVVAIDALVGVPHLFFLAPLVVHDEGVPIERYVAAVQGVKVHCHALVLGREQGHVQVVGQSVPGDKMAVHALAQGGVGGHGVQAQGALEERIFAKGLDGVEACPELRRRVVLALAEQAKIAFRDVAVGHAIGAKGEPVIDQGIKAYAL
jgi:hypothetical protein